MPSKTKARSLEVAVLKVQGLRDPTPGQWRVWLSLVSRRDAAGNTLGSRSSAWMQVPDNTTGIEIENPGLQTTFPLDEYAGAPEALVCDPSFIHTAALRVSLHKLRHVSAEEAAVDAIANLPFQLSEGRRSACSNDDANRSSLASYPAEESVAAGGCGGFESSRPAAPESADADATAEQAGETEAGNAEEEQLSSEQPDASQRSADEDGDDHAFEVSQLQAQSSTFLTEILRRFPAGGAAKRTFWEGWTPLKVRAEESARAVSEDVQVYMRMRVITTKSRSRSASKQPLLSPSQGMMSDSSSSPRRVSPLADFASERVRLSSQDDEETPPAEASREQQSTAESSFLLERCDPSSVARFAAATAEMGVLAPQYYSSYRSKKRDGSSQQALQQAAALGFAGAAVAFAQHEALQGDSFGVGFDDFGHTDVDFTTLDSDDVHTAAIGGVAVACGMCCVWNLCLARWRRRRGLSY